MSATRDQPIAVRHTGLVTSVGLDAASACAAIRAKLTNPGETGFTVPDDRALMGHAVPSDVPRRGLPKLAWMAALAIDECLAGIPRDEWPRIPLLLCVAERDRAGRLDGLDDQLFPEIERLLGASFGPRSAVIAQGRVGMAVALAAASRLLQEADCDHVVVAGTDSLLTWPTLQHFLARDRLLTQQNSNGFMPGEAAGALLLGRPSEAPELRCTGIGFGVEPSPVEADEPLRADGLVQAIGQALGAAGRQMHELDFRITDVSGEQYYFKEAALALQRTLRQRKETFDIWHPAESTGETGAAAGFAMFAVADAACRKGYTAGRRILAHFANDAGHRAAAVLEFAGAP